MKQLSRKEILANAEKRLSDMEFNLAFYSAIYQKLPTENLLNKINFLKEDIKELQEELMLFKNSK